MVATRLLVNTMNRAKYLATSAIVIVGLVACSSENTEETIAEVEIAKTAPQLTFKPEAARDGIPSKPGAPFAISYRIIGMPIVGSPLTVNLQIASVARSQPVTIDYRVNDTSSMLFAEAQPTTVRLEPAATEEFIIQQVTVIPQRDGRLYLNISIAVETENGTRSTVTAIPIHVGNISTAPVEHGVLEVGEDGEAVRVLTSD